MRIIEVGSTGRRTRMEAEAGARARAREGSGTRAMATEGNGAPQQEHTQG